MSDYSDDVQETYADNLAAETKNASSGGIGALAEHIAALAGTACEIDQAFFNIEATFESVVQENPTGAFKDDVESLQAKWKKNRQDFNDLIWQSRTVAGKAEGSCKDFADVMVSKLFLEDKYSVAVKIDQIAPYIKVVKGNITDSTNVAAGFTALSVRVKDFKDNWAKIVTKYKTEIEEEEKKFADSINDQISNAQKELDAATKKLADANKKVSTMSKVGGIVKAVGGILSFLPNLLPIPFAGIISKVMGIVTGVVAQATTQLPDCVPMQKDVDAKKAVLDKLQADKKNHEVPNKKALTKLETGLTNSKGDFDLIIDKLSLFSGVWDSIVDDLSSILEVLESMKTNDDVPTFKSKVKSVGDMYSALQACLNKYGTTVQLKNEKNQQVASAMALTQLNKTILLQKSQV